MSQSPRVWFVVGSSSGFGLSMTKVALEKGENVVASVRKADALADLQSQYPNQLLVVVFDTTNYADVKAGFALAKERFGRVDIIFNNAGVSIRGELEGVPEEDARAIFDVNFWGAVNISRETVKLFREQTPPGGRLLQLSSYFAVECPPGFGFYSASKAALEALSESLAREVEPSWNIRVTLIEPGPFNTEIGNSALKFVMHPVYASSPTRPFGQFLTSGFASQRADVDKASLAFYELASMPEPPLRFPIHSLAVDSLAVKGRSMQKEAEEVAQWSTGLRYGPGQS